MKQEENEGSGCLVKLFVVVYLRPMTGKGSDSACPAERILMGT